MKKALSSILAACIFFSSIILCFSVYAGDSPQTAEELTFNTAAKYTFTYNKSYKTLEAWFTFTPDKTADYSLAFTKPNSKVYDVFSRVYENKNEAYNNTNFSESDGLIYKGAEVSHIYHFKGGKTYFINAYLNAVDGLTTVEIPVRVTAHNHSFKEYYTVATEYDFGEIGKKCTSCGYEKDITTFNKPNSTKIKKLSAGKKAVVVKWKKGSNISGYQIQIATDRGFKKNKKTVTVKGIKSTSKTIKKLKKKKKYYVRIRTYKNIEGRKIYSSWSGKKTVKTK